ncbi:hypothetical protein L3Q82_008876, partial [Scortum barcoo]
MPMCPKPNQMYCPSPVYPKPSVPPKPSVCLHFQTQCNPPSVPPNPGVPAKPSGPPKPSVPPKPMYRLNPVYHPNPVGPPNPVWPPKPRKKSPVSRKVVPKETKTRKPGSSKNKKEPATDSPKKPTVPEPEKKIQPHESPERDRGKRVLWIERERVKPILDRTVGGIQVKAPVSFPACNGPHVAHAVHIIRYKRVQ